MCHFYSPPSQTPQSCRETMEYMPEEHDYSLLPAPIHVGKYVRKHYSLLEDVIIFSKPPLCPLGKYLRLKRIHFQLPYDVMWQWQHNQVDYQNMIQYQEVSKNLTNITGSITLSFCSFAGHHLSRWRGRGITVSCENSVCFSALQLWLIDQINILRHFLTESVSLRPTQGKDCVLSSYRSE